MASSISNMLKTDRLRRAARIAASLSRFFRSAPEKPGVCLATVSRFTSGSSGFSRA